MNEDFIDLLNQPDALRKMLLETGLTSDPALDSSKLTVQALTGGVSSSIFRVDLGSEVFCVKQALPKLKVASDWRAPVERVFAEIDWIKTVAGWLPEHVPEIVATHPASGSFVMRFLDTRDWSNWKSELLAQRVDRKIASKVGAVLGQIHQTSAGQAGLAERFAHAGNFRALRLDPYLLECARRTPRLKERLHTLVSRTESSTKTLIHGDVSPKNILLNRRADFSPLLLDAECANFGDPSFDLAFLLNHFLLKAVHMPDSSTLLLESFDDIWQAYRQRINWEHEDELQARAADLLSGLLLARIDGKSPVEYLSEENRNRLRPVAEHLLQHPPGKLEAVAEGVSRLVR